MNRLQRVQEELASDQTLLVTNATNIRYLCGFTGSFGSLLISSNNAFLLTDSRYDIQAHNETDDIDIHCGGLRYPSKEMLVGVSQLMFEKTHFTVAQFDSIREQLSELDFVGTTNFVEKLRLIKDPQEIELIKRAGAISTASLMEVTQSIRIGMTERQVQRLLENTMLDGGATAIAFETIVASGPNSAIPHHQPTDRPLASGDLLKIDFGAEYQGYKSDCTRTFVIGDALDWQQDIHHQVQTAQAAGRDALIIGVPMSSINALVRSSITNEEFRATFGHGLGHGVGLDIHEDPFFSSTEQTKIEPGMVVTIEPGIYLADRGGVRIEDTLIVTPTGYENVTEFSYDLISLG